MDSPTTDAQDQAAMERLNAGQDAALDELMGRYGEPVFRYLLRLLRNETEASDAAQESFVRVYLHRASFNPRHKFSTWLYTIATNLARDLRRHQARHPQVSMDNPREEGGDFRETLPEGTPNPSEAAQSAEQADAVRRAVAALPEELRAPLVLAVYEEKSHAEIAEILECSAKSVEMRIYRARGQLRQALLAAAG